MGVSLVNNFVHKYSIIFINNQEKLILYNMHEC